MEVILYVYFKDECPDIKGFYVNNAILFLHIKGYVLHDLYKVYFNLIHVNFFFYSCPQSPHHRISCFARVTVRLKTSAHFLLDFQMPLNLSVKKLANTKQNLKTKPRHHGKRAGNALSQRSAQNTIGSQEAWTVFAPFSLRGYFASLQATPLQLLASSLLTTLYSSFFSSQL